MGLTYTTLRSNGLTGSGHRDILTEYTYVTRPAMAILHPVLYHVCGFGHGFELRRGCTAGKRPLSAANCRLCEWLELTAALDFLGGLIALFMFLLIICLIATSGFGGNDPERADEKGSIKVRQVVGIVLFGTAGSLTMLGLFWIKRRYFSLRFVLLENIGLIMSSGKLKQKDASTVCYKGKELRIVGSAPNAHFVTDQLMASVPMLYPGQPNSTSVPDLYP